MPHPSTAESTRPLASPAVSDTLDLAERIFAPGAAGVRGPAHEQVLLCQDRTVGLKAVVSVHSTALGPALGGTRFHAYGSSADAVLDSLNLARGMSYKNALAGLPYGGGKAVIIGDPALLKTPGLLHSYGRFVESLAGRYVTACDVGTDTADMDVVGEETDHVVGRSPAAGGVGDPSAATAYGVLQGMRACAAVRWGEPHLRGRRVGVCGLGKVGQHLVALLTEAGATVLASDIRADAVARTQVRFPEARIVADAKALLDAEMDIYSPCALGGALDRVAVNRLRAPVVCGAANNQLGYAGAEERLVDRDIVYAPDYVVNAGGVIHVAREYSGCSASRSPDRAREQVDPIYATTLSILTAAADSGASPSAVADDLAEKRMASPPRT